MSNSWDDFNRKIRVLLWMTGQPTKSFKLVSSLPTSAWQQTTEALEDGNDEHSEQQEGDPSSDNAASEDEVLALEDVPKAREIVRFGQFPIRVIRRKVVGGRFVLQSEAECGKYHRDPGDNATTTCKIARKFSTPDEKALVLR